MKISEIQKLIVLLFLSAAGLGLLGSSVAYSANERELHPKELAQIKIARELLDVFYSRTNDPTLWEHLARLDTLLGTSPLPLFAQDDLLETRGAEAETRQGVLMFGLITVTPKWIVLDSELLGGPMSKEPCVFKDFRNLLRLAATLVHEMQRYYGDLPDSFAAWSAHLGFLGLVFDKADKLGSPSSCPNNPTTNSIWNLQRAASELIQEYYADATLATGREVPPGSRFYQELVKVPQDFSTIQAAIHAVLPNGTVAVYGERSVEKKTYSENIIIIDKPLTLQGGFLSITEIRANNPEQPTITVEGKEKPINVNITYNMITGGKGGILVKGTEGKGTWLAIENCSVTGNDGDGIHIETSLINRATIAENKISGNDSDGIEIAVQRQALEVTIEDNTISGNGYDGIVLSGSSQGTIEGKGGSGNQGSAIDVNGSRVTVEGNTISLNGGDGVCLIDSAQAEIINNQIINNRDDGVQLYGYARATVSDNTLKGNSCEGVTVQKGSKATISNNVIEGNGEIGVLVWIDSEAEIRGNRIIDTKLHPNSEIGDGIEILDNSNATIEDNTISGSGRHGIYIGGGRHYADPSETFRPSTVEILNNIIKDSEECGIYAHRLTNFISCSGNTVSGNRRGNYCEAARGQCH
jgi:parallel beta-helix repeat protein